MTPLIAAAAAESEEKISPILAPYPGLMFWTIVAFFISLWVLKKFAFGPIQEALDKRRATVNGAIEEAERVKAEAEALLVEYREQLAAARSESDAIVSRARTTGDELTERARTESEDYRAEQLKQTQAQIQAELDRAMGDLRSTIADLTVEATEKVLRGSLDQAKHQQLIDDAVSELDLDRLQGVGGRS